MKTITIATDFSDNAWKAASYGASLHRGIPCQYVILHAYYVPSGGVVGVDVPSIISDRSKEVNEELMNFKTSFEDLEHHDDTTFEYVSRYGETSNAITEVAKSNFSDLVILGTRGSTNNWSFAFGSTTVDSISTAPFPILAIPSEGKLEAPEQIILASDYANFTHVETLEPVKQIAEAHKSEVLVVNVRKNEKSEASVEQGMEGLVLHNFLGDIPHEYFDLVDKDIDTGLLTFAEQKKVDLILLINRERKFWERLFRVSVSVKMGLYSTIPLLVLRD
ncbi:MAG: universal stress protein [Crocinitomicaceae bacterium]|nr:universal stress protein [Crocinitomicaceae bacterium]